MRASDHMPPATNRLPRRARLARWAAPLLGLLLLACGDATGILVEVTSSELSTPADFDILRFQVTSNAGTSLDQSYTVDSDWPHSLTIVPASSQDDEVTITISGIRAGSPATMVIRRVIRARFERGTTRRLEVVLSRDCIGVMCAPGVDCRAGTCMDVTPPDAGMRDSGTPDAGRDGGPIDGGVDGGPVDGGPIDGGPLDGGPIDGGPVDGGDGGPIDGGPVDGGPPDAGPPDGGPTIPVCNDTPAACMGVLVISEFAYAGASGSGDEFVEIYNRGSVTVNAGEMEVRYSATSGGTLLGRATLPMDTLIAPGAYYLVASSGFSGSGADPGGGWGSGFAGDRGAIHLRAGGVAIDLVGWRRSGEPDVPSSEGDPVVAVDLDAGQSFERKANSSSDVTSMTSGADANAGNGFDSGDNLSDFVLRTLRDPQNASSGTEP
ncbi:MAG: lamin tail domain-containing protein [Sandaracinaceae bacterium]